MSKKNRQERRKVKKVAHMNLNRCRDELERLRKEGHQLSTRYRHILEHRRFLEAERMASDDILAKKGGAMAVA